MKTKLNSITIKLFMLIVFLGACEKKSETIFSSQPVVLSTGYIFTEGPLWHSEGFLLFSDIPANTIYKWVPGNDSAEVFLNPSGNSNGIIQRPDGALLIAQHAGRVGLYKDGQMEVLVDSYQGKRLNSPNDLVLHSNGTLYFSDPPFGVDEKDRELDFEGVFKLTSSGKLTMIFDGFTRPNGVALSPDEKVLYVNDSPTGRVVAISLDENGDAKEVRDFANVGEWNDGGAADGMITDKKGRVFTTSPQGISVFDPSGKLLEEIRLPERITNITWKDQAQDQIFCTGPTSVYSLNISK